MLWKEGYEEVLTHELSLPRMLCLLSHLPLLGGSPLVSASVLLSLNMKMDQVPISVSLICQEHAAWQLYLKKKKEYNCKYMYIVEKQESIKSKK